MVLKVKLPSGMREIDTRVHKPVVFINGAKKILDKGITFVNGQKKYLWGMDGVPVDYISVDGVDCGGVYSIGESWMHTTNNGYVTKFDITNTSNPIADQSIAWGTVYQNSGFQSDGTTAIFGTTAGNKIGIDIATGNASVVASYATPPTPSSQNDVLNPSLCITNSYNCGWLSVRSGSSSSTLLAGNNWYWNGTRKYTTATARDPLRVNDTTAIQIDTDTFLINLISNSTSGLYSANPTSVSRLGGLMNDLVMLDGQYLCGVTNYSGTTTVSTFVLYDKSTRAAVRTYSHSTATEQLTLLGRIGDNYYLLVCPKDSTATTGAKLLLKDKDTFTTVHEQDLDPDPFNENSGDVSFWNTATAIPMVSYTGFLNVSTNSYNKMRCARVGELL